MSDVKTKLDYADTQKRNISYNEYVSDDKKYYSTDISIHHITNIKKKTRTITKKNGDKLKFTTIKIKDSHGQDITITLFHDNKGVC